ncbi:hypothetical protein WN943_020863 [Citrus x changshan-huyou]
MQISTCCVFYPALVLQYIGQAFVLVKHPEYASDALYKSVLGSYQQGSSVKDLAVAFDNEESDPGEDVMIHEEKQKEDMGKEIETIEKAWQAGVVHLIGENEMVAAKRAGIAKRIIIDYAYSFLKKNLRQSDKVFDIPHKRMLKVGMTYEL